MVVQTFSFPPAFLIRPPSGATFPPGEGFWAEACHIFCNRNDCFVFEGRIGGHDSLKGVPIRHALVDYTIHFPINGMRRSSAARVREMANTAADSTGTLQTGSQVST